MGYRFTLESANTVANLTVGNVLSCYRDIYSSQESYNAFKYFLSQFKNNMYSDRSYVYKEAVMHLEKQLPKYKEQKKFLKYGGVDADYVFFDLYVRELLEDLSNVFNDCTIKSLLLPGIRTQYDDGYDFMTSEHTLYNLYNIHRGDSCLILQPQELLYNNVTVLNAFPHFNIAMRQADMWPAVLFWDGQGDCAFIPVKSEKELSELYEIIKHTADPLETLKEIEKEKKRKSHCIFQLSDLHFGAKNVRDAEKHLRSLIEFQISQDEMDNGNSIDFIVTGDAVDSPKPTAEINYAKFARYIKDNYGKKPIRVLGNHDINSHGLAICPMNQRIAHMAGEYPKIEKNEEEKVLLLLFNSNTEGRLAEGKIGEEQMREMENLLSEIEDLKQYTLIAVLHHHLLKVQQPDFYDKKWYEKIVPSDLMEKSLRLLDADAFLEWLCRHNVQIVLHGHKHIPYFNRSNGIAVIGCGSSTGQVVHKDKKKTYISYNILKISEESIMCTQYAEEVFDEGAQNIHTEIIKRYR